MEHQHPERSEARTRWVAALTLLTMVAELVVGYATGSLALTADGWHMATHAGALGMAASAYWFARTRRTSDAFVFGTGKVHALAGYTSAVALALVALLMVLESARRLVAPETVHFAEALPIAILGLVVNLISAALLDPEDHHEHHGHGHVGHRGHAGHHDHHDLAGHHDHHDLAGHHHRHQHAHDPHTPQDPAAPATLHAHDHNLRAAYAHVLADALTSVLAIAALLGGRYLGWTALDPLMGIVGGVVIARWATGLCRDAAAQLLDMTPPRQAQTLRARVEAQLPGVRVTEARVWDVGQGAYAATLTVEAPDGVEALAVRQAVRSCELAHLTVEVWRPTR